MQVSEIGMNWTDNGFEKELNRKFLKEQFTQDSVITD